MKLTPDDRFLSDMPTPESNSQLEWELRKIREADDTISALMRLFWSPIITPT